MEANEEYVRSRWEAERIKTGAAALHLSDYSAPILVDGNEFPNWQAAYDYTLAREEEIRLVEEEIALLEGWRFVVESNPAAVRILAREQAVLAELKKGMRP